MTLALRRPVPIVPLRRWIDARPWTAVAFLLLVASLTLRSAHLGNPLAGYDEQFYLLVGDRMLGGALPYVDLWDRKPVGLFALYAAIRLLGGDGVLQYQLAAALAAAGTAFVIARVAGRGRAGWAGLACGLLYLLMLNPFRGEAGQAPVFYNLLIAGAAWLTLGALPRLDSRQGLARAAGAMALCGVALTIKTTVIFESCWFGLTLLAASRAAGLGWGAVARRAVLFAAFGATPFLLAAGFYLAIGEFDAFWFANATSAMLRPSAGGADGAVHLFGTLLLLAPLALLTAAGWSRRASEEPVSERWFLLGWIAAASVGAASVGIFYEHYAMNMLVPLTIGCVPFLRHHRWALPALLAVAAMPLHLAFVRLPALAAEDRAALPRLLAAIGPDARDECLLVYGGPPILYHLTGACLPTRYPFPGHFWLRNETPALGVDQLGELDRTLATRPGVIVTTDAVNLEERNRDADRRLGAALAGGYRQVATAELRYVDRVDRVRVWRRRDLVGS